MSYASAKAKTYAAEKRFSAKRNANKEAARIDRTETCFGGKGCLTKEQYEMAVKINKYKKQQFHRIKLPFCKEKVKKCHNMIFIFIFYM